jgi:UDP-N-acetylglucosamine transferase subunit ALG13
LIFVTVGTQLPFDRLVQVVDAWAGRAGRRDVFAQIGPSRLRPAHLRWSRFLPAAEFRGLVERAELVIAHAGMGCILTALELARPILVMPRHAGLGEQRNDHQIATARRLGARGLVGVALDEGELAERLEHLDSIVAGGRISGEASPELIGALRRFLAG